jgi:hypothetical protein
MPSLKLDDGRREQHRLHPLPSPRTGWNTRARGRPVRQSDESGELKSLVSLFRIVPQNRIPFESFAVVISYRSCCVAREQSSVISQRHSECYRSVYAAKWQLCGAMRCASKVQSEVSSRGNVVYALFFLQSHPLISCASLESTPKQHFLQTRGTFLSRRRRNVAYTFFFSSAQSQETFSHGTIHAQNSHH